MLLLTLATPASSSRLDDAVTAMRSGDFAEAFCIMRPLAEEGDPDAQYNIGWMYHNGYGLRVNDNLALQWWERAASQGNTDASFAIGMLFSLGDGDFSKDIPRAVDAYIDAAADHHDDAIAILKTMIMRNDKHVTPRLHEIMDQHASLFGDYMQVKANKLNARNGPSTDNGIVAQLLKDQVVLVLKQRGQWSQVVMLENKELARSVWVYTPLLKPVEQASVATSS